MRKFVYAIALLLALGLLAPVLAGRNDQGEEKLLGNIYDCASSDHLGQMGL